MKRYEYEIMKGKAIFKKDLDWMGSQGWELCAIMDKPKRLFFRRELELDEGGNPMDHTLVSSSDNG